MTCALRLALLVLAAVVIGAAIAAHPSPADDACLYEGVTEQSGYPTSALQLWPYGTRCEMDGGDRIVVLGPSVAETLVVTAAVALLLLLAARRWDAVWARALASSLTLLGVIGLLAHAIGYPAMLVLIALIAWPVTYAVQRDFVASFAVAACVGPVWLFFDLAEEPWIGIPLAVVLAVLVAPRVRAWGAGLVGTPAPPG